MCWCSAAACRPASSISCPSYLPSLGVEQVFHKISHCVRASRFGSAFATTAAARTLVFGLPGNPVSSCVCFELFVRPAIAALSGRGFVGR